MELKTKYQYTYFIYPYVVNEKNYVRYLQKLLTSKDYKIKFFESDKDADLYEYFLPKVRNTIFWSMDFAKMRISKFESLDKNMQATVLGKYPCAIFEYNLKKDIQGKAGKKDGCMIEGMGCPGGCIAGAGTILALNKAQQEVKKIQEGSEQKIPPKELADIELL